MITECGIDIDAPAAVVWDVFSDVEHWPEWTASVTRLVGIDGHRRLVAVEPLAGALPPVAHLGIFDAYAPLCSHAGPQGRPRERLR